MSNQLDAVTAAEEILTNHYRYIIAPAERRAIAREKQLGISPIGRIGLIPPESDTVPWTDIALVAFIAIGLMTVGWFL